MPRLAALFACVAFMALAQEFEVASVKANHSGDRRSGIRPTPGGRLVAENAPVRNLILAAWRLQPFQLIGGPGWIESERYDIDARAASDQPTDKLLPMLQVLLQERFQLKVHHETRELPIYALVIAKNGPKLTEAKEGGCAKIDPSKPFQIPQGTVPPTPCGGFAREPTQMNGGAVHIANLINQLSSLLGRKVVDKTGLTGTYDIHLEWTPFNDIAPPQDSSGPSIFTALQEQLGLRLDSEKGPVDIIVIDHVERASEN